MIKLRREPQPNYKELIDSGEVTLRNGKGNLLFPTNPATFYVLAKLKPESEIGPSCYPSRDHDEIDVIKNPEGYNIHYKITSESRILQWKLVKFLYLS